MILLTCSITSAIEATIMNCFINGCNLIVRGMKSFGHRFPQLVKYMKFPIKLLKSKNIMTLTKDMIENVISDEKFIGLLVYLDKTSIRQHYNKYVYQMYAKNMIF